MPRRKYIITDLEFEKYLFHVMRLSSDDERRNLNHRELINFRTEMNMRRFSENENMDKRLLMLTRLGYSFCIVVAKNPKDLKELYDTDLKEQYDSGEKRVSVVKKMVEGKIFAMASTEMLVLSHIMAQNTHSGIFTLDYNWVALKERLNNYRIRTFSEETEEAVDSTKELSGLILSTLNSESSLTSITGCTFYEMRILLAMYQYRHTMVSTTTLSDMLGETKRSKSMSTVCLNLEKKGYTVKEPIKKVAGRKTSQRYMIAEKGINAVLTYLKYIVKHGL